MIELVIGVFVFLSTLFLCLSVDVVLRKNRSDDSSDVLRPTNVDVDLTGYERPSEHMDLNLRNSGGEEHSVLSESDLLREMRALTVTEVDFDFREFDEASRET